MRREIGFRFLVCGEKALVVAQQVSTHSVLLFDHVPEHMLSAHAQAETDLVLIGIGSDRIQRAIDEEVCRDGGEDDGKKGESELPRHAQIVDSQCGSSRISSETSRDAHE
ncbi:hypothetical protein [Aurantimonas manganoxydans]|uniref:hypothetical protein n=1 Tax=Aurantimonas manganoxydans TaxID=651183 RepID=UPI0002DE7E0B|nr:hypothetical protein [Aurantimonas manganoxydans]